MYIIGGASLARTSRNKMADPQDDAPPDYSRFPVANHRTVLECDSVEQMNTDQYFLSEGITVLPPVRPRFDGPGSPHVSPRTRSLQRPRDRISPTLISLTESGRPRNVTISTTTTNNEDGRTLTCCRRARGYVASYARIISVHGTR